MKRMLFVAPVVAVALALGAVTAFADSPPASQNGSGSVTCGATSNQTALVAKLRNDQAALDQAKARLDSANAQLKEVEGAVHEGHQPWRLEDVAAAKAEVANLQAVVQKDQDTLQQEQKQKPCTSTTGNGSATPNPPKSSGSSPRAPSEGPGLPQTGAAG